MQDQLNKARRSLSRRDPVLRQVIREVGACEWTLQADLFAALVRSIIAQQISTKAAETISARFRELCQGSVIASRIVSLTEDEMRSAGLSQSKAKSVQHLALEVDSGRLDLSKLSELDDEGVIAELIPVRGIGRWTAQMFLIFSLGRLNVLPVADLGLKTAVKRLYELEELPTPETLEELAKKWTPWCSVATWYFWRSLES